MYEPACFLILSWNIYSFIILQYKFYLSSLRKNLLEVWTKLFGHTWNTKFSKFLKRDVVPNIFRIDGINASQGFHARSNATAAQWLLKITTNFFVFSPLTTPEHRILRYNCAVQIPFSEISWISCFHRIKIARLNVYYNHDDESSSG